MVNKNINIPAQYTSLVETENTANQNRLKGINNQLARLDKQILFEREKLTRLQNEFQEILFEKKEMIKLLEKTA